MQKQDKEREIQSEIFSVVVNVGMMIVAPLLICIIGGYYLDSVFHTRPLLLFCGMICSLVVSIFLLYRFVQRFSQ